MTLSNDKISKIILFSLIFTLLSQISHTTNVFIFLTPGNNVPDWLKIGTSIFFSIGFDLSSAVFIYKGKTKWALASTIAMFVINMLYYSQLDVFLISFKTY